jgi:hypothetical protein
MFRIIGGDGREYGPVTADQLRQWLTEGRLNGETPARREADAGWLTLRQLPELASFFQAPPPLPSTPPPPLDSSLGKIIPYRNGPALAAYYCGIFALIPLLGLVLGIVAYGFGLVGLRNARRQPAVGGKVHAWVGIVLGGLCFLGNVLLLLLPAFLVRR